MVYYILQGQVQSVIFFKSNDVTILIAMNVGQLRTFSCKVNNCNSLFILIVELNVELQLLLNPMLLHIVLSLYIQYVSLEEVQMIYASFAEKRNSMIVIIKITVLEYKVKHCKTVFFSLKTKKNRPRTRTDNVIYRLPGCQMRQATFWGFQGRRLIVWIYVIIVMAGGRAWLLWRGRYQRSHKHAPTDSPVGVSR